MTLGPALIALRGPGAEELEAAYRRARDLAQRLGDAERHYRALWGLWFVHYGRGHYQVAYEMGERMLALAEGGTDPVPRLEAHHMLWSTLCARGETAATVAHVEQGLALYDPARHRAHALLYGGHDAGVCGWDHLALSRWLLGDPDRALAALGEALRLAERLAHPLTLVIALNTAAEIHYVRGELAAARECAERVVALNTLQSWLDGSVILACVAMREGRSGPPVTELLERLAAFRRQGLTWRAVFSSCLLAEAAGESGDVEAGLQALALIPEAQRRTFLASEIERLHGELLGRRDRRASAEPHLRQAVEIARARGERSLELRAATSLGRLLARERRPTEARNLVAGVYGSFTEGLDTADLRAARTLLEQLGAGHRTARTARS
jgi:adenylate cyclase